MRRERRSIRAATAAVWLAVSLWPASAWAAPAHVGSEACASCHTAEHAAWQGSHHDWALKPATEAHVLGDFGDAVVEHHGVRTRFFRRDGRFMVETWDVAAPPVEREVRYTVGVTPLQQYLVDGERGRLQALSLAWDTRPAEAGGKRWFHLLPGEAIPPDDPLHWTRFHHDWAASCASCHQTELRKGYDPATDSYATRWADLTVGCEACHGPGAAHVAWAEAGAAGTDDGLAVRLSAAGEGRWSFAAGAPIARWEGEPRPRPELEVCAACHSRRRPLLDGWTPGAPFLDTHLPALLDEGLYFPDGQIQDEVFEWGSFVQSRMHAAGVTCTDCHEPHGLRLRAEGNALCAQCHLPEAFDSQAHHRHEPGSEGALCVSCHMPARSYMVVDPRRDHSFRVPRPDLSDELGTPHACAACHADRGNAWAAQTVARWFPEGRWREGHYGRAIQAGRTDGPEAEALLRALVLDAAQPAVARATAMTLLPSHVSERSIDAYETALVDPDPLVRIGALRALEPFTPPQRFGAAFPLLRDQVASVRIEAARALADIPAEALEPADAAVLEAALGELMRAEAANAERPDAQLNLGNLQLQRGNPGEAEAAYRRALALEPSFTGAAVNLADLYRATGRDADGEKALRETLARVPEDPALHHSLGLLLARTERTAEAVAALAEAARLAPENARYAYVHGVALSSAGQPDAALAVLAEAQRRHPRDADILTALALLHRDRGDLAQAVRHAELLVAAHPDLAEARDLLAMLRGQP